MESTREERRTVAPTVAGRIHALDVLRGFAVLGILFANMPSFSGPAFAKGSAFVQRALHGTDAWAAVLVSAFVTGKFRSTLAVLFGVGLYLQFAKRSAVPGNWPGGYLKRSAWLLVFGAVHGVAIWYGDILFSYGATALVCCWLVGLKDEVRAIVAALAAGIGALLGLLAIGATLLVSHAPNLSSVDRRADVAREIHVYASGSYLEQLAHRSTIFGFEQLMLFFILPTLVALFLIGVHLGKVGFLAAPSRRPALRNWLLGIGLGVGLPANLVALFYWRTGVPEALRALIDLLAGPVLAMGYLTLVAMAVEAGWLKPVGRVLAKVGKVALSCYLMQSVICTALFYSWGLDWFNRTTATQGLGIAVCVATVNVVFALLWVRWFALGPVEWLWRSLVEGKRLPIRRGAYELRPSDRPAAVRFDLG